MSTLSAKVAKIDIRIAVLDGLLGEDGEFYVAVPQLTEIDLIPPNRSAKQLESFVGKSSQSHQFTGFTKLKTPLHPKAVNAIPLAMFEAVLFELALKGNEKAIELSRGLIGLSLVKLFSDAFGIKFETEDIQKWLDCRFNTKHDFRPLTDQLQQHGFKEPWQYGKFIHAMQEAIGLTDGTRDFAEFQVLNKLERAQTRLTTMMECGIKPYAALAKL